MSNHDATLQKSTSPEDIIWEWFKVLSGSLTLSKSSTFHVRGNYIHLIDNPVNYNRGHIELVLPEISTKKRINHVARLVTRHWFYTLCVYKYNQLSQLLSDSGYDCITPIEHFKERENESNTLFCTDDDILFMVSPAEQGTFPRIQTDKVNRLSVERLKSGTLNKFEFMADNTICECDLCLSLKTDRVRQNLLKKVKDPVARARFSSALYYDETEEERKKSELLGKKVYIYDDEHNQNIHSLYTEALELEENGYIYAARGSYMLDHYDYDDEEAQADFDKAISLIKNEGWFHFLRSRALYDYDEEEKQEKLAELHFAIHNCDDDDEFNYKNDALFERAMHFKYNRNYEDALADYKKLYENTSDKEFFLEEITTLYIRLKKFDEAFTMFEILSKGALSQLQPLVNKFDREKKKVQKLTDEKEIRNAAENMYTEVGGDILEINNYNQRFALNNAVHEHYEDLASFYKSRGMYREAIKVYNELLYDSALAYGAMYEEKIRRHVTNCESQL